MKRAAVFVALLVLDASHSACGGKVVVDPGPSSSTSGPGGAGGTTHSGSSASSKASSSGGPGGFGSTVASSGSGGNECGPKPLGTPVQQCFTWPDPCPSIDDAWSHMPYCCPEGFTITQIVDGPTRLNDQCCYDVVWADNCSTGLEK